MALRYLRETGQVVPSIEAKATQFVNAGYQRLLTFESPTGGFNWWGDNAPGVLILTALGVQQFQDMSQVHEVDRGIIDRAKKWLARQQQGDGSWPTGSQLHGYNQQLGMGAVRTTAYVLWSLLHVGDEGPHIERAARYLKLNWEREKANTYSLALAANALVLWDAGDASTKAVLAALHEARQENKEKKTISWPTTGATAMYSRGHSASVETTALAVMAFIHGKSHSADVNGGLAYLIEAKGSMGDWGSTQATILALRALLLGMSGGVGASANLEVEIFVDGKKIGNQKFTPENSDVMRLIDVGVVEPGQHRIELKAAGEGNVMYQIVGEHFVPWRFFKPPPPPLAIAVKYDATEIQTDNLVGVTAKVRYNPPVPTFMVIVDLGIPPGFEVVPDAFQEAVAQKRIRRFSMTGRQITIYLGRMSKQRPFSIQYQLRAKYPVKAKTPQSVAYEYYTPTSRGVQAPEPITIID